MDGLLKTYVQPQEYHFSQESVELAKWASLKVEKINSLEVLDVGAGCGVIGIELFHQRGAKDFISLIEKQSIFLPFQLENTFGYEDNFNLINKNFIEHSLKNRFDVILCNPPYFLKERSRASSCDIRNNCRQILELDLFNIFKKVYEVLKDDGHFFFVFRNDEYKWLKNMDLNFIYKEHALFNNYRLQHWVK